MKSKQFFKKLELNKKTIVDLERLTMSQVKGGTYRSIDSACTMCNTNLPCTTYEVPCNSKGITCTC
jgi:hypothetical protein